MVSGLLSHPTRPTPSRPPHHELSPEPVCLLFLQVPASRPRCGSTQYMTGPKTMPIGDHATKVKRPEMPCCRCKTTRWPECRPSQPTWEGQTDGARVAAFRSRRALRRGSTSVAQPTGHFPSLPVFVLRQRCRALSRGNGSVEFSTDGDI